MSYSIFKYFIFIGLLFSSNLNAQIWTSVQQLGSKGGESCQALTTDNQNNIYLSGGFNADFPLGDQTLMPVGDIDIYLTKLNESGEIQWTLSGGSIENDEVVEIAVDNDNNIYWTGMYWLNADFGDTILNVESSSRAIFMIKYTADGDMLWAKSFDGTGLKQISDVVIDDNNDLYLTGYFKNTLTLNQLSLNATADTDIFVAKMTAEGEITWASQAGLEGENLGISVAIDHEKNVLVGGHYQGKIAFQNDTIQSNTPDRDVFIAKFSPEGEAIWGRKAGGVFPSELTTIAVDETDNIFATGTFLGVLKLSDEIELQTDGFNKNIYLLHYDKNGTALWAKSIGGTDDEIVNDMFLKNEMIVMTGNFVGNMIIDDFNINNNSNLFNGFVTGFSLTGETKWLEKMASSSLLLGEKITINNDQQVLVAGVFIETAIFNQMNYPSNGSFDIFLTSLNQTITPIRNIEKKHATFSIFPNPTKHSFFIKTDLKDFKIKLTNLNGQVVKTYQEQQQIKVNDLPRGIYYVILVSNKTIFTKKIALF